MPPRPDPGAEAAAAAAAGLEGAITFRAEPMLLDEALPREAPAGVLTLADAVRCAVTSDPGLQAALARVRIAMADADQARLLPNPILSVALRWEQGLSGKPVIEASLAQDLVWVLRRPRAASAADNRLRQAAADAVTTALDVTSEVQERYTAAQSIDALIPLLVERRALLERLTGTVRARLEAGEGTRGDVTAVESQRLELEVEIDAATLDQRRERLHLARLIGEPSSAADWVLDPWAAPVIGAQPESVWIDAALTHRPEVQALAWRLAALGDDYALARLLPWDGTEAGIEAERDGDWTLGPSASVPLPLFDSGQAARARVSAEQIEARHTLTLVKRKVVEEVRVAYQTLAASRANLSRLRDQLIPLQEERRRQTEEVFRAERDIVPLLLAEQDLRASLARGIEIERQAAEALLRLQRAVGGPGVAASLAANPTPPEPTPDNPGN